MNTARSRRCVGALLVLVGCALSPADAQLYTTDFEAFAPGSIDGQDGWCVGPQGTLSSFPGFDDCQSSADGSIVVEGSGNQVLEIVGQPDFGFEVGRDLIAPSGRRYLRLEMDFNTPDPGGFWFMDNIGPGPHSPDSVFWFSGFVFTNATPGGSGSGFGLDTWHRGGIEIDQEGRRITAILFDGTWHPEDDSLGIADPRTLSRFFFRGIGPGVRLWLDDLSISEHDNSVLDADGDGVSDDLDVCPATAIPEGVPTLRLGVERWALVDGDGVFDTMAPAGGGGDLGFSVEDTGGCSCEQIIAAQGLGQGHVRFGCSNSAMLDWVALVSP